MVGGWRPHSQVLARDGSLALSDELLSVPLSNLPSGHHGYKSDPSHVGMAIQQRCPEPAGARCADFFHYRDPLCHDAHTSAD